MSQPVHITNIFAEQTRYSVDAVQLKNLIEPNLTFLKDLLSEDGRYMRGWNYHRLRLGIEDLERVIAQLDEDLLINKII